MDHLLAPILLPSQCDHQAYGVAQEGDHYERPEDPVEGALAHVLLPWWSNWRHRRVSPVLWGTFSDDKISGCYPVALIA